MSKTVQRLIAEFMVIVVGVLLALAVDQWRQDREDVTLEYEYAQRLLSDLRADVSEYDRLLNGPFVRKLEFLTALERGEIPTTSADAAGLLRDLEQSTWGGIIATSDAAFREMQSTGRIGLLHDPGVRAALAEYYAFHGFLAERYYSSAGEYDRVAAEGIPGSVRRSHHSDEQPSLAEVRSAFEQLLREPGLSRAVNAELAYLGGLEEYHAALRDRARRLIDTIEVGYPD